MASSSGASNAVELLLRSGANYRVADKEGRTVLHLAIGHSKTLRTLIEVTSVFAWNRCVMYRCSGRISRKRKWVS